MASTDRCITQFAQTAPSHNLHRPLHHTICTDRSITQFPTTWGRNYLHHGQQTLRLKVKWCSGGQRCSMWSYSSIRWEYSHRHCDVRAWNKIQLHTANFEGKIVHDHRKDEVRSVTTSGDRNVQVWSDLNMRTGDHKNLVSPKTC